MSTNDPYDLQRFVAAQAKIYHVALAELRAGRKRSHWMWFVFPQLRGLGRSPTAQHFGLGSLAEAQAFLAHPLLGPRLKESTTAVCECATGSLHEIFGAPDDLKFCSSMTLFDIAAPNDLFGRALAQRCGGQQDKHTLALLDPR